MYIYIRFDRTPKICSLGQVRCSFNTSKSGSRRENGSNAHFLLRKFTSNNNDSDYEQKKPNESFVNTAL